MFTRDLSCCGATELIGLNDVAFTPKVYMLKYADMSSVMRGRGKSFVVFSYAYDTHRAYLAASCSRSKKQGNKRLEEWEKYIKDNDLGTVHIAEKWEYNPNYKTKVRLRCGIWQPNNKNIYKFLIKEGLREKGTTAHNGMSW